MVEASGCPIHQSGPCAAIGASGSAIASGAPTQLTQGPAEACGQRMYGLGSVFSGGTLFPSLSVVYTVVSMLTAADLGMSMSHSDCVGPVNATASTRLARRIRPVAGAVG